MAPAKRKEPIETAEFSDDDEFNGAELDGAFSDFGDDSDAVDSEAESLGLENDSGSEVWSEHSEDDVDDNIPSGQTRSYRVVTDANGGERYEYDEIDPVYDSDDSDAQGPVNTIGNIPLSFYDSYPHIGYDINGKKIMRPATGEALDALLDSIEIPKGWTGLTDPETGKPLNLSQNELELLRRLQMNQIPTDDYDPYPVCLHFATTDGRYCWRDKVLTAF